MFRTFVFSLLFAVVAAPVQAESLPSGARARLGTTRLWHGPHISQVLVAPDGKTCYSMSTGDKVVRQWNLTTGEEVQTFTGHKEFLTSFALSRDGRLLVTASNDCTLRLWNTAEGELIASWPRKFVPQNVALSPDGNTLAVLPADESETLSLLEAATGKETHKLKLDLIRREDIRGFRGAFSDIRSGTLAFSPTGKYLAVQAEATITVWDLAVMKKMRRYDLQRNRGGNPIQFASNGQTLFAADTDVQRWELDSLEALEPIQSGYLSSLAVSADGRLLVGAGEDRLHLWDGNGKQLHALTSEGSTFSAVACSPDGKTVVTGDRQGQLRVWEAATGKERLLGGPRPDFSTLAFLGDDNDALVSADRLTLIHWDSAGKEKRRVKVDVEAPAQLMLSPDGRTLAVHHTSAAIALLDTNTGEVRTTLEDKERRYCELRFSSDGRWFAVMEGNTNKPLVLHDARTGKELRQFTGHGEMSECFAFLPDNRALVTFYSMNDSLTVWELASGKARRQLNTGIHPRPRTAEDATADMVRRQNANNTNKYLPGPQHIAVAPDGRTLAIIKNATVSIVDLHTGQRLWELDGYQEQLECVTFSPDGKLLVGGSREHTLFFWDPATGKTLGLLNGHRGGARQVSFSPDGKRLVTTSDDRTALIWDVAEALEAARQANRVTPPANPLEQLWTDLGNEDALRADAAVHELAVRPKEALALLKEHLHPIAAVEAARLAQWLADLDSNSFEKRQKAAAELEKLGEQARDTFKAALANKPSSELKRRITGLLEKLDQRAYSPEILRDLRALEALEMIGDAEARTLLESMASGSAADPRTQDARAALERLKRR